VIEQIQEVRLPPLFLLFFCPRGFTPIARVKTFYFHRLRERRYSQICHSKRVTAKFVQANKLRCLCRLETAKPGGCRPLPRGVFYLGHESLSFFSSPDVSGGTPSPPRGYFGRMFLVFLGLQSGSVCKIFHRNGLRLKYCKIRSCAGPWPPKEKAPVCAGAYFHLF
jgi:hypothetical protein